MEVEGARTLFAACNTPASENVIVHTHSPKVIQARKTILKKIVKVTGVEQARPNQGRLSVKDCFGYELS